MNCNVPTDIWFSFEGFRTRGGQTGDHVDGWGIAFFEGQGYRLFTDTAASIQSDIAHFVRKHRIRSTNVIAHIRKATHGEVCLENNHPFVRELWGRYWLFAHNGDLKDFEPKLNGRFTPVGTTDSEKAFCMIMERFSALSTQQADIETLYATLASLSQSISQSGTFNFILSNGEYLFANCTTDLHYVIRQAPFSTAHLIDKDIMIDFNEVTAPEDRVAVIATSPLTDNETWEVMKKDELLCFHNGKPLPLSA